MKLLDELDDERSNSKSKQKLSPFGGRNTPDEVETVKNSMIKNLNMTDNINQYQ